MTVAVAVVGHLAAVVVLVVVNAVVVVQTWAVSTVAALLNTSQLP